MKVLLEEEGYWKCHKHASQPSTGVCPTCLRNRLILLCPECADERPCACCPSVSPSDRGGASIGAVGRVSFLIHSEPAFSRSRSAASRFLPRPRSGENRPLPQPQPEARRKSSFWSFLWPDKAKTKEKPKDVAGEDTDASNLLRSISVGASRYSVSGSGDARVKGRSWHYFSSPIKVFRQPKANPAHRSSPPCRG